MRWNCYHWLKSFTFHWRHVRFEIYRHIFILIIIVCALWKCVSLVTSAQLNMFKMLGVCPLNFFSKPQQSTDSFIHNPVFFASRWRNLRKLYAEIWKKYNVVEEFVLFYFIVPASKQWLMNSLQLITYLNVSFVTLTTWQTRILLIFNYYIAILYRRV